MAAFLTAQGGAGGAGLQWGGPLDLNAGPLGLPGAGQASNGAVAVGMRRALAERGWPIDGAGIRRGFAGARWPGRLQQVSWRGRPLLLDGAHNLPAAIALRAEIDTEPARHGLKSCPRTWVPGSLANNQGPDYRIALPAPG